MWNTGQRRSRHRSSNRAMFPSARGLLRSLPQLGSSMACCTSTMMSALGAVVGIQRDVVMAEVGGEDDGAGVAAAEVEGDGDALAGEDARGVLLAVGRGLAVGDERDVASGERDAADGEARAAAADRGEDAAPVRVAAVQRGLDQRRGGHGVRGELSVARAAGAADFELHHARGPFAVADYHPGEVAADFVERGLEGIETG